MLHNLVHLAVGAALILAAMASAKASRTVNSVIGVVYLVVGVAGLFILDSSANILALNGSDNALHVVSGAALLAVGMWAATVRPNLTGRRASPAGDGYAHGRGPSFRGLVFGRCA